jgi:hypothetical protein
MDFDVELFFRARWRDGGRGIFSRRLRLPFAPFPGLRVYFSGAGDDGDEVKAVTWVADETRFVCEVGADLDPRADAADLISFHNDRGWSLEGG